MNPFNEKPAKQAELIIDWEKMWAKPYDKRAVDPYTRTRIILMNGTEFENVWFSHQFSRATGDNELRRQLALLFTTDEAVIMGATMSFYVLVLGMMPQNGRVIYSGCLRGAGDVRYVAVCALLSVTVLRPILTYVFCYPIDHAFPGNYIAVMGPWIAFVIDAFVRQALLGSRIKRDAWLEKKLA